MALTASKSQRREVHFGKLAVCSSRLMRLGWASHRSPKHQCRHAFCGMNYTCIHNVLSVNCVMMGICVGTRKEASPFNMYHIAAKIVQQSYSSCPARPG